jgi:hypothetical protein
MEDEMKMNKSLFWVTLVVIAGLLTACSGGQQPTTDPNMIFTQAAQTVSAQLSATAASLPTSTATPEPSATPTETVAPTATLPLPTVDAAGVGTPASGVSAPTSAVPAAPSSSDQVTNKAGDSAGYSSQMPADGSKMYPGVPFSLAFTLINTGSTTWGSGYRLKFIGGEQCSTVSSVEIDRAIKPGEKFEFFMAAFAPRGIGKFESYWGFYNPQNVKIYEVYLSAEVIKE